MTFFAGTPLDGNAVIGGIGAFVAWGRAGRAAIEAR